MTIPEIQKLLEQGCEHLHYTRFMANPSQATVICKPCAAAAILELERVQNKVADVIHNIDKALGIR